MTIRTNLPTAPQTPQELGEHAVVLGASMGGLLAASVLANFFRSVTVVERDVLPDDPANRRGVPQGRHAHLLLPRGAQILDELFPGLLHGLVVDGAPVLDDGDLSKFFFSFGGHQILRSGKAAVDSKGWQRTCRAGRFWSATYDGAYRHFETSRSWKATTWPG